MNPELLFDVAKHLTLFTFNFLLTPAINLNGQNKSIFYSYTLDGSKLRETVENNGDISKTDYDDLRTVQYMAGHKRISSTERYQVGYLEDLQESINKCHPLG